MTQPKKSKGAGSSSEEPAPQEKFLEIARNGKDAWNVWRRDNPKERANFSGVNFTLDVNKEICFAGFVFGDNADFSKTIFGDAPIAFGEDLRKAGEVGASSTGAAIFEGAVFGDNVRFCTALFGFMANFDGAVFGYMTDFSDAVFGVKASFDGAAFKGWTHFDRAAFSALASFTGAKFGDFVAFDGTAFGHNAHFNGAAFAGGAMFGKGNRDSFRRDFARYAKSLPRLQKRNLLAVVREVDPEGFESISFSRARFGGVAEFTGRSFNDNSDFSKASFLQPPDFRDTKKRDNLDWTGARFGFRGKVRSVATPRWTTDTKTATDLRRLRKIASEIHAHDAERDLFILERMAERGIGWSEWWQRSNQPGLTGLLTHLFGWGRMLIPTILMAIYRVSSNCGRSVFLPLAWLGVSSIGFGFWYTSYIAGPIVGRIYDALVTFTLANALPFVGSSRQATSDTVKTLFCGSMPDDVYSITLFQGLTSVLLLFLVGLALRAHFKVR